MQKRVLIFSFWMSSQCHIPLSQRCRHIALLSFSGSSRTYQEGTENRFSLAKLQRKFAKLLLLNLITLVKAHSHNPTCGLCFPFLRFKLRHPVAPVTPAVAAGRSKRTAPTARNYSGWGGQRVVTMALEVLRRDRVMPPSPRSNEISSYL